MPNLAQLPMTFLQSLLMNNPNAVSFPFSTTDFPLGVTRANVEAAFIANLGPTNSGNFDPTTGKFNSATYAPGIILNGGLQVAGGLQVSQPNPNSLPVVSPAPAFSGNLNLANLPSQVI